MTRSVFGQLNNQAIAAPFWADLSNDNVSHHTSFDLASIIPEKKNFYRTRRYLLIGSVHSMLVKVMSILTLPLLEKQSITHVQYKTVRKISQQFELFESIGIIFITNHSTVVKQS
jgi:hypothetical protein